MLIASNRGAAALDVDQDEAFWKVVNSVPAHVTPAGCATEMVNLMVDPELAAGKPRQRYGVELPPWGRPHASIIPAGTAYNRPAQGLPEVLINGFTVGQKYLYLPGNASTLCSGLTGGPGQFPGGTVIAPNTVFEATQTFYYLFGPAGQTVLAGIYPAFPTMAYYRYTDPEGNDTTILITSEPRTSDGGQGRAWRILPNNQPLEIPLNGHDIWGASALVPVYNGMLLLRDGNERHYFPVSAIGTNEITLNCTPAFENGDEVQIVGAMPGSAILGTAAPNLNATYFVNAANAVITLYDTRAHAVAGGATGKLAFNTGTGSFYIERISTQAGYFGNGAPVLIMQGTDLLSPFDVGFVAMPEFIAITNTDNAGGVVTAPNHRLKPGDAILITGVTGFTASTTYYAYPITNDTFNVYSVVTDAILNDGTNQVKPTNNGSTGQVSKNNASGQPIAPSRLGINFLERSILVASTVDGGSTLLISDPDDPVHYTPVQSTVNANLGDNSPIVALMTAPYDTLIIIKKNAVLALANLSQANTNWLLYEVTREYGGVAPLAIADRGTERWFLSRRGVDRIRSSITGNIQGVPLPVSGDIQNRFQSVDWSNIGQACAALWNNRVFLGLPLKGQVAGSVQNNGVLVYNSLARPPGAQGDEAPGGWEDLWQGAMLTPFAFANLIINGEERLTFATAYGLVCWFTDGFCDTTAGAPQAIYTRLVTRGYFKGQNVICIKGEANWDTFGPNITVSIRMAGVNEQTPILSRTYNSTQYQVANAGTYNPSGATAGAFIAPHRADYSPSIAELTVAALDTFQNTTEPLVCGRARGRAPQFVFENFAGAMKLNNCSIAAKAIQTIGQQT